MSLCLIDKPMKCVVDLFADVSSKAEEFSIDTMQNGLEEVALTRVLTIEQIEQLHEELLIDVLLGCVGLKVRRLQEPQEKLVNNLEVGPGRLQIRFVLFRVEFCTYIKRKYYAYSLSVRFSNEGDYGVCFKPVGFEHGGRVRNMLIENIFMISS